MTKDYHRELRDFWGEKLVQYPNERLQNLPFSEQDASLLTNLGLPQLSKNAFQFWSSIDKFHTRTFAGTQFIIIGDFSFNSLGINVETSSIFFINKNDEFYFMNSNLEALLMFLMRSQQYYFALFLDGNPTKEQLNSATDKLKEQLFEIDQVAFQQPNFYWPTTFQEMRFGLV